MSKPCSGRSIGQNKNSKTLWQDKKGNYPPKGKNNIPRLDMEGDDIHLHVGNDNEKYFYKKNDGIFISDDNIEIPKSLKKKLNKDDEFQRSLNKILKGDK